MAEQKSEGQLDQKQIETLIKEADSKTFESIPIKERSKVTRLVRSIFVSQTSFRSGPLPPPEELARYNEIIGFGAERIFKMAEDQSVHRRQIEAKVVDAQIRQSDRGQHLGFVVAVVFLGGALWVTFAGHDAVGGILGGTTIVGIVTAFVTGKWQQKKDLEEKSPGAPLKR